MQEFDTTRPPGATAVTVAEQEVRRQGLDPKTYSTKAYRDGDEVIVIYTDPDTPLGGRGNMGAKPALEVYLSYPALTLKRSAFVR